MSKLDPRIEAIRAKYDLATTDFWELPQKRGSYSVKHAALELVAAKAGIKFDLPQVLEANGEGGTVSLLVTGHFDGTSLWSIGECSPKNNKNSYPWAMAEKRAIDRVILKLVGIHGLVYSEDEADDFKEPARAPEGTKPAAEKDKPPAQSKTDRREYVSNIKAYLAEASSLDQLKQRWAEHWPYIQSLEQDWKEPLIALKDDVKASLESGYVPPNFEGMEQ